MITKKYTILKIIGKSEQICLELNELIKNDKKIKLATPIFMSNINTKLKITNEKNGYAILECCFDENDTEASMLENIKYYVASIFGCSLFNNSFISEEKGNNIIKESSQITKKDNEFFTQRNPITLSNFKLFNRFTEFYWKSMVVTFDKVISKSIIRVKMLLLQRQVLIELPYNSLSLKQLNDKNKSNNNIKNKNYKSNEKIKKEINK